METFKITINKKTNNTKEKLNPHLNTWSLDHLITYVVTLSFLLSAPALAFEDVIITNNAKLTNIKIENHDVIDVFPLVTIMNDKNTIIVHPLTEGESRFTVLKDGKKLAIFLVKVETEKTKIEPVEGFDILTIDYPPNVYEFELDKPPLFIN